MSLDDKAAPQIGELNGLPLFLGSSPTTIKNLLADGEDVFYVLGYEGLEIKVADNSYKKTSRPAIYMVIKNLMGYTQIAVDDKKLDLNQALNETCQMSLPKIPWELQEKMSQFFHKAFKLHGTESVLILVYDEDYLESENPSLGWGCIAPVQENTSGSCYYEVDDTVVAAKKETESIVGSVHSHPLMSAFASGTDHKDQADWDGLHITYGWKTAAAADEYHIELIIGGQSWMYKPEDIFDRPPMPALGEENEVDQWLEKVTKKEFTGGGASGGHGNYGGVDRPGGVTNFQKTSRSRPDKRPRAIHLPVDAPTPNNAIMIGSIRDDALDCKDRVECVLCRVTLIPEAIENMRCFACKCFIAFDSETIDVFHERFKVKHQNEASFLDPDKADKPIHFFVRNEDALTWGPDVRDDLVKK